MIAPKPNRKTIDLKALKASVDVLALVRSRGFEPKRHGTEKWKIVCPFHKDEEASLIVTPRKNLWHCFGCGKGGSSIDFVKELDGLSTGEAIRKLAENSGAFVRLAEPAAPEPRPRTAQQQNLLNKVAEFYHKALFNVPEGRTYLKVRGLYEAALLETFRIGYVDSSIREAVPPEDVSRPSDGNVPGGDVLADLQAVGILDAQGREHFRDCVTFPIFDERGNVVEMYGRKVIESKVKHLYLSGPHAGVFNHTCARASSSLLLTESVIDAATLWQAGYKNVTALYGTNGLTEDHLSLFRRNQVETVYLVMDGDDAGRRAAEKIGATLKAEGLDVFAVVLPEGEDPNSFFQSRGVEDFDALLKVAAKKTDAPQSDITAKLGAEQIEEMPDGFAIRFTSAARDRERPYHVRLIESDPRRLRATIKALTADRNRFHIDTVDLLSARSRKAFVADVAALYHEDADVLTVDLNRIVTQCEARAEQPEKKNAAQVFRLTEEDRREAERFGKRPDLMEAIAQDIEKCGTIGERANALAAYLCMTSRKMPDPLALLIVSGSGAGKSALQETVLSLCPPEDLVKVTSLTERALFYKDETSLKHKVLALEEAAGAEDAAYAIRNLISQKVLTIESTIKDPLTGRLTTMENKVYGPTAVFQTTTRPDLDPETQSRFLVTSIDESREQTAKILYAQRKARTLDGFKKKLARETILKKHHAFQRLLRSLPVFNPFADLLTFTDERLMTRRDQPKYLALIETTAFLHQMQKPVKQLTEDGRAFDYIEVSLRDIALANELAILILGHSLDELSGPSRKLLLLTEEMVAARARARGETVPNVLFTRRELREHTRWSDYQVKTHVRQLEELEYFVPVSGRFGQQFQYRLAWTGEGREGQPFVLGLKSIEQLRREAEACGLPSLEVSKADLEGLPANLAG